MLHVPQPSAIPVAYRQIPVDPPEPPKAPDESASSSDQEEGGGASSAPTKRPHVKPSRKPLLRLEIHDLSSRGARDFLKLANADTAIQDAVTHVLDILYMKKSTDVIPPTRSVTLILRDMDGVAYTTGKDFDNDHKEIHFSTRHIEHFEGDRCTLEIMGVLVHEMVHAWQWNGQGTAPGGLIEGIADFVRLKAGFAPPHWKKAWKDCDWDSGYERTGYFLDWLEGEFGEGTVRLVNERLRDNYEADSFWKRCCGCKVDELWKRYKDHMEKNPKESMSQDEKDCEK